MFEVHWEGARRYFASLEAAKEFAKGLKGACILYDGAIIWESRVNYIVLVRAFRNLTADITVAASSREEAERLAIREAESPGFKWDESEPEDFQVENVESES